MEELEGHAPLMAWDWVVEDIDPQEDNDKMWVPVIPQTLKVPSNMRDSTVLLAMTPLRQMLVFAVKPS